MLKILLLEDNPDDAELCSRALKEIGSVTRVDGREPFERALDQAERFDVILGDYSLPAFDGLSALQIARRKCPEVPFLFVSGTIHEDAAIEALKLGAADYLFKDRLARLPSAVERAVQEKRLQTQLLRAQRMENIGALASGIAHDLNNLLSPVLLAFTLVESELSADKRRILDSARTTLRRGAEMLRQILTFLRGTNGAHAAIDVPMLLNQVLDFLKSTFPKNVEVNLRIARPIPPVSGNATQIHQVLLNLCVNARDAMPGGGTLDLSADAVQLKDYRPVMGAGLGSRRDSVSGSYVRLMVIDDGCGMRPKTIARLFEPFFTTKEAGKGTGLGLSTALTIARAHGGFLDVFSMPAQGAKFSLYLPASAAPEPQVELPAGNGQILLLVDDELAILEITKALLETFNYRVITASNAVEALRLYHQQPSQIFAVITDLLMPVMDGATFIARLRQINPAARIVCLSGGAREESLKPSAWISKPFTSEELLSTLHELGSSGSGLASGAPRPKTPDPRA